jgi:hypothetical protein
VQRGPQAVAWERGVRDQPIVLVADLVAGRVNDGHPVGLGEGEGAVTGGDEPVPRPAGEEIVAARVVEDGFGQPNTPVSADNIKARTARAKRK